MKPVTDIQHARVIISKCGEPYQNQVVEMLRILTYNREDTKEGRKAQKVIDNMLDEYTLNVANVIWADKYQSIPQWIKEYDE